MAPLLRSFLQACQRMLATTERRSDKLPLTFVIGNEGGDMDSVMSAIFTALLLCGTDIEKPTFIPVMNFPSSDLRLRQDIATILKEHDIIDKDLTFEEHLNLTTVHPKDSFFLVDHNVLRPDQRLKWGNDLDRIVGIIDHHSDENIYTLPLIEKNQMRLGLGGTSQRVIRAIEPVGSASSLVALQYKRQLLEALRSNKTASDENSIIINKLSSGAATLLLAPITMDTKNFKKDKGKVMLKDVEAKEFLLRFIGDNELMNFHKDRKVSSAVNSDEDDTHDNKLKMTEKEDSQTYSDIDVDSVLPPKRAFKFKKFYKWLQMHKSDVSCLTSAEQLRRDFKKFLFVGESVYGRIECGISTILLRKQELKGLYSEDHWILECKGRMDSLGYNLHLSMLTNNYRELEAVFDGEKYPQFKDALIKFSEVTKDSIGLELKNSFKDPNTGMSVMLWTQREEKISRKNMTPMLVDHFRAFFVLKERDFVNITSTL